LCQQRIGGEKVYLIVDKYWVSVRKCLEESSTGHVQSYTMCTYWIMHVHEFLFRFLIKRIEVDHSAGIYCELFRIYTCGKHFS